MEWFAEGQKKIRGKTEHGAQVSQTQAQSTVSLNPVLKNWLIPIKIPTPKLAEVNNHVPNHKVWARTLSCHCLSSPHMSYINSQACMMSTKWKSTSLEPAFYAVLHLRIKATLQQHSSKGRRQRSSSSDQHPSQEPKPESRTSFWRVWANTLLQQVQLISHLLSH